MLLQTLLSSSSVDPSTKAIGGDADKDQERLRFGPFHADVDGEEGCLALVLGDRFLEQPDDCTTFLEISDSSPKNALRIAGTIVSACGTAPHGRTEG